MKNSAIRSALTFIEDFYFIMDCNRTGRFTVNGAVMTLEIRKGKGRLVSAAKQSPLLDRYELAIWGYENFTEQPFCWI